MDKRQREIIKGEVIQIIDCFLNNEPFPSNLDVKIVFDKKTHRIQPPNLAFEGTLNLGQLYAVSCSIRLPSSQFYFFLDGYYLIVPRNSAVPSTLKHSLLEEKLPPLGKPGWSASGPQHKLNSFPDLQQRYCSLPKSNIGAYDKHAAIYTKALGGKKEERRCRVLHVYGSQSNNYMKKRSSSSMSASSMIRSSQEESRVMHESQNPAKKPRLSYSRESNHETLTMNCTDLQWDDWYDPCYNDYVLGDLDGFMKEILDTRYIFNEVEP